MALHDLARCARAEGSFCTSMQSILKFALHQLPMHRLQVCHKAELLQHKHKPKPGVWEDEGAGVGGGQRGRMRRFEKRISVLKLT